jgi:hypothetical protein
MYLTNYTIQKKFSSYYNAAEGFCFLFPSRWDGVVTARNDADTGDIIFCKYTAGTPISEMPELMRVTVVEGDTPQEGAKLTFYKDNFNYYIYTPNDTEEPLLLTDTEIQNSFRLL